MAIVLFGLTGGVAAGKSTVAGRFRDRGVPVIDADALARAVVAPGTEGLAEVVAAFGREVLGPDGALDRPRLGRIVFGDPAERTRLESIVHPRIRAAAAQQADELARAGIELCCYEAALLVEQGLQDRYRPLVVVAAPAAVQVARLMARDGLSETEARQRLGVQLPLGAKVAVADFVIENAGSLAETLARADEVVAALRAGVPPRAG